MCFLSNKPSELENRNGEQKEDPSPRENGQQPDTPFRHEHFFWAGWDPPKGTEGAGGNNSLGQLPSLPTVLAHQGGTADQRLAEGTPIDRKSWKKGLENYRPVSLTVRQRKVTDHLESHHETQTGQP